FPTRGKVIAVQDGMVVFTPRDTTYEMHLRTPKAYTGPLNTPVDALIRLSARKLYTVPSGGNFITPIFGPPRIVQGRVKYLDEKEMVVQAGTSIIVQLPAQEDAYDLASGDLTVASLVNVVALPGAKFALAPVAAAR